MASSIGVEEALDGMGAVDAVMAVLGEEDMACRPVKARRSANVARACICCVTRGQQDQRA